MGNESNLDLSLECIFGRCHASKMMKMTYASSGYEPTKNFAFGWLVRRPLTTPAPSLVQVDIVYAVVNYTHTEAMPQSKMTTVTLTEMTKKMRAKLPNVRELSHFLFLLPHVFFHDSFTNFALNAHKVHNVIFRVT